MRKTLEYKIRKRISLMRGKVFVREDFADLGGYDQVGRALRSLIKKGTIVKIGYGLYVKAKASSITGETIPQAPLPILAREALVKLGIQTAPSRAEEAYNSGRSTQVPTGRVIAIEGRFHRKIGYNGAYVSYEAA